MKTKVARIINRAVFGSRLLDECKTILRLSWHYSLIAIMIVSAGCNPSTVNNNHTTNKTDPNASQRETQLMGGGTGGGTGDGGGGQGVQCSDSVSDTNIKGKLLVRDIYEAIRNHKRSMPSASLGASGTADVSDAAIDHLVKTLKAYFGPASVNLHFVNAKYWKTFADGISFIADDATIHPSQDANSPLALPKGCNIVQIAYWDESSGPVEDGTLYVDKKSWIKLDQFNKIALLAHEYFFKQARKAGYRNSDFVRHKVGQLLSDAGLPPAFPNWAPATDPSISDTLPLARTGFKYCEGTSEADPTAKLQMYQYEGSDMRQHIVFPIMTSSSVNFSELQIPHVAYLPEENQTLNIFTDMLVPTSHYKKSLNELYYTNPEYQNTDYLLGLRYTNTGLISYKHTDAIRKLIVNNRNKFNQTSVDEVKWTLPAQANSKTMSIALHNPFVKYQRALEIMKPREDLIAEVNNKIYYQFPNISGQNTELIRSAILALNKEMDDLISQQKYNSSFPLWNQELKRLNTIDKTRVMTSGMGIRYQIIDSDFDKNVALTTNLPKALFSLKSQTYNPKEIMKLATIYPYQDNDSGQSLVENIRGGVISFRQGDEKVSFNLNCKDYIDVYKARTIRKEYSLDFNEINNNDVQFVRSRESFMPGEVIQNATHNLDRPDGSTLSHLALLLKSENGAITKKVIGLCDNPEEQQAYCTDLNSFFADMQNERSVEMSYCMRYPDAPQVRGIPSSACAILSLKQSQQKYLVVYGDYSDTSKDKDAQSSFKIGYILRIPR